MDRKIVKQIWNEVLENNKRLNECPGPHDFIEMPQEEKRWTREYRCSKCNGKIDAIQHLWYQRGLNDGRKHAQSN